MLSKDQFNCPYLILAPMEGVGDYLFRKAIANIGGFDEAVTEFLRVPINAHVKSLARQYNANEINPIPIAAQIMGSDPVLMAAMAREIEKVGAPRIDINFGCPSNTVTRNGAGSTLLKDPNLVYENAKAVVKAVSIPVSVKMRSGYQDTSLFKENLLAAQESGISYITLHPRTKEDGYKIPANWALIAEAKSLLKIKIVGNGDILNVEDALKMLSYTKCDGLMIGRGSLINPFIFQQIRSHFSKKNYTPSSEGLIKYINIYAQNIPSKMPMRIKINKMKQLMGFLFQGNEKLLKKRHCMLTNLAPNLDSFLEWSIPLLLNS